LIKIKSFKSRPDLTGRSAVIDGKRKPNGRIPVMIDGEEEGLLLNDDLIETFHQCPNEKHSSGSGKLPVIWPHVKGVATPTVEWIHDEMFDSDFVDVVSSIGKGRDRSKPLQHTLESYFGSSLQAAATYFGSIRRLEDIMKWSELTSVKCSGTTEEGVDWKVTVFFNKSSNQRVNDWSIFLLNNPKWKVEMQHEVEKQTVPIICGPMIVVHQHPFSQLTPFTPENTVGVRGVYYNSDDEKEGVTTNSIQKQLYSMKYHPKNFETRLPLSARIKNSKTIDHRLKQLDGILSTCPKALRCHNCIIFEVNHRKNEITIQKLSVHLNSSTKTASAYHTERQAANIFLDKIAMCCQEQEVHFKDFFKTMLLYGILEVVNYGSKDCSCHCYHPSSTHHRHSHTKSNLYEKTADRHIPKAHPAKLSHPHLYEKFKDEPGEYIHPDIYRVIALRFCEKYGYGPEILKKIFHRDQISQVEL